MGGWWREIASAIEAGRLSLIVSPQLVDEFLDVVARPRFASQINMRDAQAVAELLRKAEIHSPAIVKEICRDPSDDFLLALAAAADADVLVSRDEDLLSLNSHGRTGIVHVADFLKRVGEQHSS